MAASQLIIPNHHKSTKSSKPTRSSTSTNSGDATHTSSSATDALARSNLLRLETSELLSESFLHVHPLGDGNHVHYEAKWSTSVRSYLDCVKGVIGTLDGATLSPNVAQLPTINAVKEKGMEHLASTSKTSDVRYRVPLLSDKHHKSLAASSSSTTGGKHNHNPLTSWSFPFSGGKSLTLHPIGSFAHLGNAGLVNRHANGNVLPMLDVAVLADGSRLDEEGEEGKGNEGFVGGKDYLNHRYTDVSFYYELVCQIVFV